MNCLYVVTVLLPSGKQFEDVCNATSQGNAIEQFRRRYPLAEVISAERAF